MKAADFRRIALSLEGAEEGSHMGAADFRVGGRIFATLASEKQGYGNLMLTPEQQAEFVRELPGVFLPIHGGMGKDGSDPHSAGASERGCAGGRAARGMDAAGGKEYGDEEARSEAVADRSPHLLRSGSIISFRGQPSCTISPNEKDGQSWGDPLDRAGGGGVGFSRAHRLTAAEQLCQRFCRSAGCGHASAVE